MDAILDDSDVDRALDMAGAVAVMKRAFLARAAGELVSPPRNAVRFGDKGPSSSPRVGRAAPAGLRARGSTMASGYRMPRR